MSASSTKVQRILGPQFPIAPVEKENLRLQRVSSHLWAEALSYLTVSELVDGAAASCKHFWKWAAAALPILARNPRQGAYENGRPNSGFLLMRRAFTLLRNENLTWEELGAKYAHKTQLVFCKVGQFPPGYLRGVQARSAATLDTLIEQYSGGYDDLTALIGAATNLRHVQLKRFSGKTVDALFTCRQLTSVNFTEIYFDAPAGELTFGNWLTKLLASPCRLEEFHLDCIDPTEALLKALESQTGMRKLTLGNLSKHVRRYVPHKLGHPSEPIRQQLIKTLVVLARLEFLHLNQDCHPHIRGMEDKNYVVDATLAAVAKSAPGLTSLALEHCYSISAEGVAQVLKGCPALTSLALVQDYVERSREVFPPAPPPLPAMLPAPAAPGPAPGVAPEEERVNPLTDTFVISLMNHAKKLRNLRLNSKLISDVGVTSIAACGSQLERLDLRGCNVTDFAASLWLIPKRMPGGMLPHLLHVDLRDTNVLTTPLMLALCVAQVGRFTLLTHGDRYDVAGRKMTAWKA